MRAFRQLRALALCGAAFLAAPFSSWSQTLDQRIQACMACHGPKGNSSIADIPSIAAQPRLFIENQLVLIREGIRDIPAMKALLDGVSDDDIGKMARYFAEQPVMRPCMPKASNWPSKRGVGFATCPLMSGANKCPVWPGSVKTICCTPCAPCSRARP